MKLTTEKLQMARLVHAALERRGRCGYTLSLPGVCFIALETVKTCNPHIFVSTFFFLNALNNALNA